MKLEFARFDFLEVGKENCFVVFGVAKNFADKHARYANRRVCPNQSNEFAIRQQHLYKTAVVFVADDVNLVLAIARDVMSPTKLMALTFFSLMGRWSY